MIHNRTVAAVICLHFGADFITHAMRSVLPVVDEFVVCYSPVPNHSHARESAYLLPERESRENLQDIVFSVAPDKVRWFEYPHWRNEGEQFQFGYNETDAGVIVKLDADEIYPPDLLSHVVMHALEQKAHHNRVPLTHYWRSFRKGFTGDPAAPGRVYLREFATGETTYTPDTWQGRIQHLGYSLPLDVMRYKMSIHGHMNEFVDPNWFENVYAANRQTDCHPCGHSYWAQTEDITPPDFLLDHPFAQLELIE